MKNKHTILKTFKAIRDCQRPIDVGHLQELTGFDKRRVQRHVSALAKSGLVEQIGKRACDGYRYIVTPSIAG